MLFWLGAIVSELASVGTAIVFWREIKKLSPWAILILTIVALEVAVPIVILLDAESAYSPFILTESQKRRFAEAAIAPVGGPHWVQLNVSGMCQDCQVFEYAIRDILNDLPGWKAGVGQMLGAAATIRGVEVWVTDKAHQPESALVIERAFQAAHVRFTVVQSPDAAGFGSEFVPMPVAGFSIMTGPL